MLLIAGKVLPDVCMDLNHFKDAFDWVEANNSGRIIPREGVDTEYDSACKAVKEIESSLLKHLKEQMKLLGSTSVRSLLKQLEFNLFILDKIEFLNVLIYQLQITYVNVGKDT